MGDCNVARLLAPPLNLKVILTCWFLAAKSQISLPLCVLPPSDALTLTLHGARTGAGTRRAHTRAVHRQMSVSDCAILKVRQWERSRVWVSKRCVWVLECAWESRCVRICFVQLASRSIPSCPVSRVSLGACPVQVFSFCPRYDLHSPQCGAQWFEF